MPETLTTWPCKNGLRVGYLNINSARNKTDDIGTILQNNGCSFHCFCFSESRLSSCITDADISMPGYQIIRSDPVKNKPNSTEKSLKTGLLLYIATSVQYKKLDTLNLNSTESLWIEITLKHSKPLTVGFIYRNPGEKSDWYDNFDSLLDQITMLNHETIILGDFNIDLMKCKPKWHSIYSLHGFEQLISKPTRITESTETLIDHIYTTEKQNITEICTPPSECSDHNAICLTWYKTRIKIPKVGHKKICYRNFKNLNKQKFLLDLANSQLNSIYQIRDPEEAANHWINSFMSVYNKHAPLIEKRVKQETKPPWITKAIDVEINLRNQLKNKGSQEEFKKQRNKVTSMKRKSKRDYFQQLLISSKDSRQIWKAINMLTNKHRSKSQHTVPDVSNNQLNYHFANIKDKVITHDRTNENDLSHLKRFLSSKHIHFPFDLQPIAVYEVNKSILSAKPSKSRDVEGLDINILKIACPFICESLTYLYNLCIDKQFFPSKFKQAKVIPIHKSGDTTNPSNYRPISILSTLSKPLEKHIQKSLYSYLEKNDLLHEDQSGFRKHHSCHTALTQLVDHIYCNINENKFTGLLFLDFEKAFDVINHHLLLRKLILYKVPLEFVKLIKSFLSNRKQTVSIDNKMSDFLPVYYGVPQGSILGPLLFSLYINDLPCLVNSKCEMFADDSSLHSSDANANNLVDKLQNDIESVVNWTKLNHMSLNAKKTKCMYATTRQKRKKMKSKFPPLFISNNKIDEVESHKILGVVIDKDLSWSDHINSLGKSLSRKTLQLAKIKHFLDNHSRKLFFNAHILSMIDYASNL